MCNCSPRSLASILQAPAGAESFEEVEAQLEALGLAERSPFGQVLGVVGGGARQALPGVIQGASTGAAAGPWGAVVGGLAGGATSLASSAGRKPRRPAARPPAAPAATRPPVPQAPPAPVPVTGATDDNAAAQLLAVVQHPQMLQALAALAALAAGRSGASPVPAGRSAASPAAFATLLGTLAQRATGDAGLAAAGQAATDYLRGDDGEYAVDPASPDARADALLGHLLGAAPSTHAASAGEWLVEAGLAEAITDSFQ